MAIECEAEVYKMFREALFQYKGQWKKWFPFYGVKVAEEIKVSGLELFESNFHASVNLF